MSLTISELLLLSDMISNDDKENSISVTANDLGEDPNLVLCRLLGSGYVSINRSYDYRVTTEGRMRFSEQRDLLTKFANKIQSYDLIEDL